MAELKSSGASKASKKDLKTVKAEQKARRKAEKIEAKDRKKAKKANKRGFFKQIGDVFKMTRKYDPSVLWWMIGAFVAALVVGLVIGLLTGSPVLWTLMFIPLGLLAAIIIMNKKAEKAAFAQIEGRPGAAGAALSQLGRGWIVEDEPIAVNPRTQETVFRAVGKAGVVLVADGDYNRAKRLAEKQRKHLERFLPNVEIRVLQVGHGPNEVELHEVKPTIKRMKKTLNRHEVRAVEQRISSLPVNNLGIPKGIDPNRMRPDRKAMRGR
ncbi:DUF4191 domain-containing protein [Enteractinococcus fodinae]|uniref:ElaB/YqjD/DUF883 family membrane-anchored ribosome-binding protein n=1 Tax=Enteractinococcus fodinae TaxID=684663 RepID=A0ABU2B112_9MICC|nr:DUF4191 domain-containing protein [Enteractinococcus fodinae]MDR7347292.1 ElaB/YqjD/DUF883 family membrane-anchored ribosome-binding protein [Enteractinococcus fodinae]